MHIVETPAGARMLGYDAPPKPRVTVASTGHAHGSGQDVAAALDAFYDRCRQRSKAKAKEKQNGSITAMFKR